MEHDPITAPLMRQIRQNCRVTPDASVTHPRLISWPLATVVVLYFAVLVAVSFALPARVPLHWNAQNIPDSYGTPAQFASIFAVVGVVVFAVFVGVMILLRRAPVTVFNVPYPGYWKAPERQEQLRRMLQEDTSHILTGVFLFLIIVLGTVTAWTLGSPQQLGWLFWTAIGLFLVFMIGYIAYMISTRYRPAE